MPEVRRLKPGDEPALDGFLRGHLESSVYLLTDLHGAGLVDDGKPGRSRFAGALEDGRVTAVACHIGNGLVLLQAPGPAEDLIPALLDCCRGPGDRRVEGFIGPWRQIEATAAAYDAGGRRVRLQTHGLLQRLSLDRLRRPAVLDEEGLQCRLANESDVALLAAWRAQYEIETMAATPGPALDARTAAQTKRLQRGKLLWLLEADRQPVSMIAVNARFRGLIQLGGGFTPAEQRGHGYARLALAGTLDSARAAGRTTALFVTAKDNLRAQRAYAALGFKTIGEHGMLLYETARP